MDAQLSWTICLHSSHNTARDVRVVLVHFIQTALILTWMSASNQEIQKRQQIQYALVHRIVLVQNHKSLHLHYYEDQRSWLLHIVTSWQTTKYVELAPLYLPAQLNHFASWQYTTIIFNHGTWIQLLREVSPPNHLSHCICPTKWTFTWDSPWLILDVSFCDQLLSATSPHKN